jgi:hypothetical protein
MGSLDGEKCVPGLADECQSTPVDFWPPPPWPYPTGFLPVLVDIYERLEIADIESPVGILTVGHILQFAFQHKLPGVGSDRRARPFQ